MSRFMKWSFMPRSIDKKVTCLLNQMDCHVCCLNAWGTVLSLTVQPAIISRRLPGFKNFSYAERLKRSNLPSLELRRLHCDLLRCYKIMFGHADINFDDMFELRMSTDTRRHKYKLFKKRNTSSLRSSFYTERVVNVWTRLPSDVVNFNTLSAFEQTIKLVAFTDNLTCL